MKGIYSVLDEERPHRIKVDSVTLEGNLSIPDDPQGIVVFIHESGSNRFNPTNRAIARQLFKARMATLLFDMLNLREAEFDKISRHLRFDIDLMVERAKGVTDWVVNQPGLSPLPVGYFGCGRGAATALIAASQRAEIVSAVVSLGGRIDLAKTGLLKVKAPTLLIVGMLRSILAINERAMEDLPPKLEKKLEIFPDVSYFWGNPDTLSRLTGLVNGWFEHYLPLSPLGDYPQPPSEVIPA